MDIPPNLQNLFNNEIVSVDVFNAIKYKSELEGIINSFGEESANAQAISKPMTTYTSFVESNPPQKLFFIQKDKTIIGFLKVGQKSLYIWDEKGQMRCESPLCLLDFYISQSCQRNGYGYKLFSFMLENEQSEAREIAYDKPTEKTISFLQKYYNLTDKFPESYGFVVYKAYYEKKNNK